MKIILTILTLLICSGCQSWPTTAFDIANEPYHPTDNNCVHKAKKFILLEPESNPKIWVVRIPKKGQHALVKRADGWWVDPTSGVYKKTNNVQKYWGTVLYLYEETKED